MYTEPLRRYLAWYEDLGIRTIYRRAVEPAPLSESSPPVDLPGLAPESDNMLKIAEDIGDCRRCR
ncbi:MAG: uracil-DNA glycosylase, partial [Acidobacteria bacterium]|nr:uracil-DNA glycosylase [Acidobacteriota bacterium]